MLQSKIHKRDQRYHKDRYGKNYIPKTKFGTSVSEREKTPKRDGTDSLSGNNPEESPLSEMTRWQIRKVGRDPRRYCERKAPNCSE